MMNERFSKASPAANDLARLEATSTVLRILVAGRLVSSTPRPSPTYSRPAGRGRRAGPTCSTRMRAVCSSSGTTVEWPAFADRCSTPTRMAFKVAPPLPTPPFPTTPLPAPLLPAPPLPTPPPPTPLLSAILLLPLSSVASMPPLSLMLSLPGSGTTRTKWAGRWASS